VSTLADSNAETHDRIQTSKRLSKHLPSIRLRTPSRQYREDQVLVKSKDIKGSGRVELHGGT
jgi:hypothetical protein